MPAILHYDPLLYLTVMERLSPHVIMRRGMIEGIVYPDFAEHISEYLAKALYYTSDLALPAADKKELVAKFCGNTELCKITEDLIFTDPYMVCDRNRWTSPQLDEDARRIREDAALKRAVSALKLKFLSEVQALLHGDLHTGSIMITEEDTRVIDPEFAFVGPMAFDVGKLIGNLLMSHFSQRGHEASPAVATPTGRWILETAEAVWTGFERRFLRLWDSYPTGDAYPRALFDGPEGARSLRRRRPASCGACSSTRWVRRRRDDPAHARPRAQHRHGRIKDPDLRARCERRNLRLARDLVVSAERYPDIAAVTRRAREIEAAEAA